MEITWFNLFQKYGYAHLHMVSQGWDCPPVYQFPLHFDCGSRFVLQTSHLYLRKEILHQQNPFGFPKTNRAATKWKSNKRGACQFVCLFWRFPLSTWSLLHGKQEIQQGKYPKPAWSGLKQQKGKSYSLEPQKATFVWSKGVFGSLLPVGVPSVIAQCARIWLHETRTVSEKRKAKKHVLGRVPYDHVWAMNKGTR